MSRIIEKDLVAVGDTVLHKLIEQRTHTGQGQLLIADTLDVLSRYAHAFGYLGRNLGILIDTGQCIGCIRVVDSHDQRMVGSQCVAAHPDRASGNRCHGNGAQGGDCFLHRSSVVVAIKKGESQTNGCLSPDELDEKSSEVGS